MVNFLNFEYVLTIHKAGTIRAAADELYISPQALSEHLGKLERELGTPLFHRTKPLTLTEAGEEFLSCAEACLEARRRLDTKLSSIAQRDNQRIALGVPTGMPPPLLLSFLDYFRHIHPELTVTVAELPTRTGAFHEIPGHIDLVIGEFQGENSKLSYTSILHSEQFTVVLRKNLLHRSLGPERAYAIEAAVRQGELLHLSEFRNCPFVLKRTGSIIRDHEDRIFHAAGFSPKGAVETGDMELTIRLVLLGQAAVYFPEPVARANFMLPNALTVDRSVLLCPLQAPAKESWQLIIGSHRYRRLPGGTAAFIEAAQTYYQSVLGP